jgi:hypothetical protein
LNRHAATALALAALLGCKKAAHEKSTHELVLQALAEAGCATKGSDAPVVRFTCGDVTGSLDESNLDAQLAGMADPAQRLAAARQFVKGGTAQRATEDDALPRASLLPMLKARAAIEATLARVAQMTNIPAEKRAHFSVPSHTLAGDVVVVLVVDRADTMDTVTGDHLARWKTTPAEVFPVAVSNLAARAAPGPTKRAGGGPLLAEIEGGDEYTATRLLLPDVQRRFVALLGGPAVFALPTRDRLLAARSDNPSAIATLRAEAVRAFSGAAYPITDALLAPEGDGSTFRVVPERRNFQQRPSSGLSRSRRESCSMWCHAIPARLEATLVV